MNEQEKLLLFRVLRFLLKAAYSMYVTQAVKATGPTYLDYEGLAHQAEDLDREIELLETVHLHG